MANTELLRFSTAGSVDDGKSTLIGRLLFDAKSIFEDQLAAVERTTQKRGGEGLDLALLTDGLIAEREQGITIDVAYRYFATPRRKFIIADTPGHLQYTRNMATGASTADLSIVLVDAAKGLLPQSRRHAIIAGLLGVKHLVVAVNKMDLVNFSQARFDEIRESFTQFIGKLNVKSLAFVPVSALNGDMVVDRGENLGWYSGPTLLDLLETVDTHPERQLPFRFPVQLVARPEAEWDGLRGYMGRIESGAVRVGERVRVLPSGLETTVKEIVTFDGNLAIARAPQAVTLVLADQLDISRGDMIVPVAEAPQVANRFTATVVWMDTEPLDPARKYLLKHTTRTVRAVIEGVQSRLDVDTAEHLNDGEKLYLNDVGIVRIKTQQPLAFDSYLQNRASGSFVLIDEATNHTVAAGMIK